MSKQYQLIKAYPGSLTVGAIVFKDAPEGYKFDGGPGNVKLFSKDEIENYPEYWQKISSVNDRYLRNKYEKGGS